MTKEQARKLKPLMSHKSWEDFLEYLTQKEDQAINASIQEGTGKREHQFQGQVNFIRHLKDLKERVNTHGN